MEREDGFYWVLDGTDWTIAKWDNYYVPHGWIDVLGNTEYGRSDADFHEIDERPIKRTL